MNAIRIHTGLLNDFKIQRMPDKDFKIEFMLACSRVGMSMSSFVRPYSGRLSRPEWEVTRKRIFARDDYTCSYCGLRGARLECDHIFPIALGGTHDDKNLTTSCFKCNRSKGKKTLSQWKGK
jgi:hypothetical protein